MGFFLKENKIKYNFIEKEDSLKSNIVFHANLKKRRLYFNRILKVPDNYYAIIVSKKKITDYFTNGEYKLNYKNMPKSFKINKINKKSRDNLEKRYIKAKVLFIHASQINNLSMSPIFFKVKDANFKKINVKIHFKYNLSICNPVLIVKNIKHLNKISDSDIYSFIEKKKIKDISKYINKKKISILDFKNTNKLSEGACTYLNKKTKKYGYMFENINIAHYEYHGKLIKKLLLLLKKNQKIKDSKSFEFVYEELHRYSDSDKASNPLNLEMDHLSIKSSQNNSGDHFTVNKKYDNLNQPNKNCTTNKDENINKMADEQAINKQETHNDKKNKSNNNEDIIITNYDNNACNDDEFSDGDQIKLKNRHTFEDYINRINKINHSVKEKKAKSLYDENYIELKEKSNSFFGNDEKKIEKKNRHDNMIVCDNCGNKIPNGEFVCSVCHSIIIK